MESAAASRTLEVKLSASLEYEINVIDFLLTGRTAC